MGKAECGECELGHRVLPLSCLGTWGTWVHGYTGNQHVQGCWGAWPRARTRKQLSARLTANPGPAPLICCARQDQPSFKHWLPCAAGLRWSCAGAGAARHPGSCALIRVHRLPTPSSSLHCCYYYLPPPHHTNRLSLLRRRNSPLVTRRPTSPSCDRSVKTQITHSSLPSPLRTLESTSLERQQARLLLSAVARSHSFPADIACL